MKTTKSALINARLTPAEKAAFDAACVKLGVTATEVLVNAARAAIRKAEQSQAA